jgi:membrane fusion protein, heavy metal efflux system
MKRIFVLFVCLSLTFTSCRHIAKEEEHSHGPDPISFTLYQDHSELFVEFKPLVTRSTSKFAAHLTRLKDFKPVTVGSVTVSLIKGKKGIRHRADSASSPGIFRLALNPKEEGSYTLIFDVKTPEFSDRFTIHNVKVYPDQKAALADQKTEAASEEVTYLKEQAWKTDFANVQVKTQSFTEIIKTTGQIVSAPGDEVTITAKASGNISFSGGKLAGSGVNAGENLFILTAGGIADNNFETRFQEARNNYNKSKADFERAEKLIKDKIISQKDFEERRTRFENDKALYNTLSKNYSLGGQKLNSPIKGFIKNILVAEGQFVNTGQAIATISQNKKLVLKAEVFQKDFPKLAGIVSANFKTSYDNRLYNLDSLSGRLISYGKNTGESFFLPVNFEFDNKGGAVPGSFVEVYLRTKVANDALVIPASALLEEQGNLYVYVQTAGESFQKRPLKIGATDGQNVQVLSGISEGERVVSKGAYQIKLTTMSGTLPAHGHEH